MRCSAPNSKAPSSDEYHANACRDLWSGRAWIARLAYSFFILAFVLAWQWRDLGLHPGVTFLLVCICVMLGVKGVKARFG